VVKSIGKLAEFTEWDDLKAFGIISGTGRADTFGCKDSRYRMETRIA
jgi:hypothetical protein